MKVELNIENDDELRSHIKDAIKGQVLSIVRDEFLEIVRSEISRKIESTNQKAFDYLFNEAMKKAITDLLRSEHGVSEWYGSFIEPIVKKHVEDISSKKDWNKLIDQAAKEKIKTLIS